jgi:hypothetical protein
MATKVKNLRASLVELWTRIVQVDDKDANQIYINGENNAYPNEIERVINNSPTASRCARLMAKYIAGAGVVDSEGKLVKYKDLPVVNPRNNLKITDIISAASRSISYQYGVFIHVGYAVTPGDTEDGAVVKSSTLEVLDYTRCRISKEDTEENPGKIYFKDFEVKKSKFGVGATSADLDWFYPFNPNEAVVMAQISKDAEEKGNATGNIAEDIKHYRGQVYYLNLTPEYIYSISPADSVYNEADTEYRISLYSNKQVRSGFLGKTAVVTAGLDPEDSEDIKKDLAEWLGAENSDNMYHLELDEATDLDAVFKIIQVKGQYDEKMFSETNMRIRKNIFGAFNNIPEALVLSADGAMFGTNSETYKQMKIFYSEQTEEEREKLQECLSFLGFPVNIKPIASNVAPAADKASNSDVDPATLAAQAALKGSVGGVQGILGIQSAVAAGNTSFESGLTILMEIYGFDRPIASALLGQPGDANNV